MMRTLSRGISTALIMFAAVLTARAEDSTIVVIDHASGTFMDVYRSRDGTREAIAARNVSGCGSPYITVRTSDPVKVVMRNFNTALSDTKVTTKEFESPDHALYQGLFDELKPYAVEVPLLLGIKAAEREGPPEQAVMKVIAFRDSITELRAKIIWRIRALSLLDSLSPADIGATHQFAAWYLGGAPKRLRFLDSLAVWYDSLGRLKTSRDVNDLREQSKDLITRGLKLEHVLLRLSTISNRTELDLNAHSTWRSGVTGTVTVTASELVSYAGLDATSSQYSITLLPDPIVRPMSALSVIHWSGTDFQTFSIERQTGGYVIRASKDDISHWSQGLSFGLSWRFCDFRDVDDDGIAFSIPELIVNPFDKFRAIGLGVGASYGFATLSVGVLWIRNTVLDGRSVGDMIDDPAVLRTMPAYTPRLFLGLGIYNASF